jgi:hypothetical protein
VKIPSLAQQMFAVVQRSLESRIILHPPVFVIKSAWKAPVKRRFDTTMRKPAFQHPSRKIADDENAK